MISRVEVERFSLTSSRSFDEVLAAINDAVGHPEMAEFWSSTQQARTVGELENSIQKALGRTGLMSFVQFDHGAIVRKATGRDNPRMVRLVIGNPLIMQEMAKHVRTPALMLRANLAVISLLAAPKRPVSIQRKEISATRRNSVLVAPLAA
jgi:hypothetical protein